MNNKKIVKDLVRKTFPGLRNSKIRVKTRQMYKWSMFAKRLGKDQYQLIIDPKRTKKLTKKEFEAILVHELCHFERFGRWNYLQVLLDKLFYIFKVYKRWSEGVTDKMVIEKGYAQGLASQRKRRLKEMPKEIAKIHKGIYMTPKEIKTYAKKIGKW